MKAIQYEKEYMRSTLIREEGKKKIYKILIC